MSSTPPPFYTSRRYRVASITCNWNLKLKRTVDNNSNDMHTLRAIDGYRVRKTPANRP